MSKLVISQIVRNLVFSDSPLDGDSESILVKGAIFKEDFGPWKAGQRAEILLFDFEHGDLTERREDGQVIRWTTLKLATDG